MKMSNERRKEIINNITAVLKQGELLGSPEVDNQQPSLSRNTFEGSETSDRNLTFNDEVSNITTSALPAISSEDIVRTKHITYESLES